MTNEELDLLSKIVLACKGLLGVQAAEIPQMRDDCWRLIDELDKALASVKEQP